MRKLAERIVHLYLTTAWGSFNRTGAGVIGLVLIPLMWVALFDEIVAKPEALIMAIVISTVFIINALPLTAFVYLAIVEYMRQSKIESDENFLPNVRKKFQTGNELSHHEMTSLHNWIIDERKKGGSELTLREECYFLLNDEKSLENLLFHSEDEEFVEKFLCFQEMLSSEDFAFLLSKVPNRMRKLQRRNISK